MSLAFYFDLVNDSLTSLADFFNFSEEDGVYLLSFIIIQVIYLFGLVDIGVAD
jgi:hypothetical protein